MRGLLVALGLLAVAFLHAWIDADAGIGTWLRLRQDLAQARSGVVALRAEIERLEAEERALRHDPFAVERAIREDLDLVRPDEILVRMPRDAETGAALP